MKKILIGLSGAILTGLFKGAFTNHMLSYYIGTELPLANSFWVIFSVALFAISLIHLKGDSVVRNPEIKVKKAGTKLFVVFTLVESILLYVAHGYSLPLFATVVNNFMYSLVYYGIFISNDDNLNFDLEQIMRKLEKRTKKKIKEAKDHYSVLHLKGLEPINKETLKEAVTSVDMFTEEGIVTDLDLGLNYYYVPGNSERTTHPVELIVVDEEGAFYYIYRRRVLFGMVSIYMLGSFAVFLTPNKWPGYFQVWLMDLTPPFDDV